MLSYYVRPYCHWVLLASLAFALSANSQVRISEFLAQNDGLTRDQDGDSPDWIELHNSSPALVNIAGWHLTDTPTNLAKWTFPTVSIPANSYLLVFASGKNRAVSGAELHTGFQLEDSGGFLALADSTGSVVDSYNYPAQRANVSFGVPGVASVSTPLITSGATARYLVPADGSLGIGWTAASFDDATWNSGPTGLGFSSATGLALRVDFNERVVDPNLYTMPGFSSFVINSNVSTAAVQTNPTTRVFENVTVTLFNTAGQGYDDRLRTAPTNNVGFTHASLLRDFVFSRSLDNGGLDLTIGNLLPNQPYTITIWSFDSSSPGTRVSDWFANGALVRENYTFNGSVHPTSNDDHRFTFDAFADANGQLLVSARRDSTSVGSTGLADFGVFLNAFELTGSGSGQAGTDLAAAMRDRNASVFIRMPFVVTNPAAIQQLRLRMKYDDGFVAHINGQQVATRNSPASPTWNSTATAEHPNDQAAVFEEILVSAPPGLLAAGQNVLAIQGLNLAASDEDFLILPELDAIGSAGESRRYFKPPTPGVANGSGFTGLVADTRFSVDRGFYDAPFTVALTCDTPGATIYWTTNGSAPSPTNGQIFSAAIPIAGTAFLRAAAYLTNHIPSDVDTHTYIFLSQVLNQSATQPGYPTTWQGSYPADYGMDPTVVNHPVYGLTISNDLRTIPTLSIVSDHNGLWSSGTGIYPNSTSSGAAWERATSVELIDGDGNTEFAINGKIEMHGNASRDNARTPKHSMRLSFNSDFGPTKLRYDWFDGGVETHDGIVLRSCGFVDGWAGRYADPGTYTSSETGETFRGLRYRPETTCYLRDVWMKDSFRDMGGTASRSAFVHLYINGLYWGLYQPSERLNASYFAEHLDGPEGAWDVLVGHDSGGTPVVVDGSVADWQTVLNLANAGITTESSYQAISERIDIDNLIDYMMLHIFAESEDWPHHNWYVAHRRATNGLPATKFMVSVWDQELTLDRLVRRNRVNVGSSGGEVYSPGRVYQQLRNWPEFRRQFGDRVHQHLFNTGALTPSNNVARLLAKAAVIRDAVVGESARWGDAREFTIGANPGTGQTFTRDEWWQPEIDKLVTNFFQKLTADNVARFRAASLYPNLHAPAFSQFGGAVPGGFHLGMAHTNAAGTIFFTTDGADPRTYGTGAVASNAQAFSEAVAINAPTRVRARVFNAGQWSALVDATFFPPQDLSGLALTEIMYNPPALGSFEGDDLEFIELKNRSTNTLDLSGLVLGGISFTFTNGTRLAPGEFFVLARNAAAFATKYPGVVVNGIYTGRLDNGGEALRVSFPFGGNVFAVAYEDDVPWPLAPDNFGYSIVPKNFATTQSPDNGASWRASSQLGGSPGADDPEPAIAPIVINEVLTASSPPAQDWIELFNPTASAVDVGGWFLTDDANAPAKFRIPDGTMIAAGGYVTFTEAQFNVTPGTATSFSLSSQGEQVYLFSGDASTNLTGYSHGFTFDAAAPAVSFGRYVNSVGDEHFPAQTATSSNRANFGPRVGPVVINEVHYHPAEGGDEFIELRNISAAGVAFYDPAYPNNSWRIAGLDYAFPSGFAMTNGYCLIVATNPAFFRAKYGVPQSVAILGPWSGALQDSGERLRLQRPGTPDTNGFGYITVDEVRYNDKAPWPAAADGTGASLQRITAAAYANDPTNWSATLPTPGQSNGSGDSDFDGMPDEWEFAYGTDPLQNDAQLDPDGDGRSNLQEYVAGTDPLDAGSRFEIVIRLAPNSLSFESAAGRVYTVQTAATLGGAWNTIGNEMAGTGSAVTVPINIADSARFYRVLVQRQ
jgi:hypothetical protein